MEVEQAATSPSFCKEYLSNATNIGKPISLNDCTLLKMGTGDSGDVSNFYLLVDKSEYRPVLYVVSGTIETLQTTPYLAIKSRGSSVKMDRYSVRIRLSDDAKFSMVQENFEKVKTLWTNHPSALSDVAIAARFRRNKSEFDDDPMKPLLSGLDVSNEAYFPKQVASLSKIHKESPVKQFVQTTSYECVHELKYPKKFHLRPLVPIFDKNGEQLGVMREDDYRGDDGYVYFQFSQHAYNEGIHLMPDPIAVVIKDSDTESPMKKAKRSSLV